MWLYIGVKMIYIIFVLEFFINLSLCFLVLHTKQPINAKENALALYINLKFLICIYSETQVSWLSH